MHTILLYEALYSYWTCDPDDNQSLSECKAFGTLVPLVNAAP